MIPHLEGQTDGHVYGSLGRNDRAKALEKRDSAALSFLALHGRSLVPGYVLGDFNLKY